MATKILKSEFREDYVHDRAVIIAPKRSLRPHDIFTHQDVPVSSKNCPFCNEPIVSKPGVYHIGTQKKWRVKVIQNDFPVVTKKNAKVYGTQEVVLETPWHNKELAEFSVDHIRVLFEVYAQRTTAISRDKKIKYMLIFKNNGGVAGQSLMHAHSQIFATSIVPPHIISKLSRASEYETKHGNCYYCDLMREKRMVPRKIYSDKNMIAFTPYASLYNYEAWILPKRHIDNITQLTKEERISMAKALKGLLLALNSMQLPYNFYMHQVLTNDDEHFYLRVAPRRDTWAGIELGSRLIINTISPEEAAKFYRKHILR